MNGFSKVVLMGNLTRDPVVKEINRSSCVLNFAVGVNKRWKGQDGQIQERANFPSCVAWDGTARFIERYFEKGSPIVVMGELQTRTYVDKNDTTHYVTDVFVERVFFAGEKNRGRNEQRDDYSAEEYTFHAGYAGDDFGNAADVDVPF